MGGLCRHSSMFLNFFRSFAYYEHEQITIYNKTFQKISIIFLARGIYEVGGIEMGYILPVNHYPYQNYQNRMIESKKGPHYVGAPYKVRFNKLKEMYDFNEKPFYNQSKKVKKEKEVPFEAYHIAAMENAKLVGKGTKFNVQI